ncbi:hypothetical protein DTO006G1_8618 [Penicillium roqueforti]|uniref:uncharacterized protein n=1 Tax=Penicillium roqueforti TaxID=5082 RepID=UPI00190AACD5|nr:uncharacterized protein LCP9604111_5808 [Penicillium roqueforti]KAF9248099.1 hypothetical protein LCP9604111_5808 [Penicillium roqueforti]KAI1830191.1 hypothetical protein CBS147337_8976 [Penicillium roqueforti]KAI2714775.1 hypothetical protein CBS147318_6352 [Penicillium roqueforti]KAI2754462.1 hypothetical protein DTO006G1_8618 [Penicillium roqueforti]KAI3128066.1 hypothetical protein CBS147330_5525 [Penicillium roqueforti]
MASTPEMPPETSLPFGVFSPPRDAYEWKKALADVKWLCFNQQYKQCAMRCNQLIETASSPLHPISATYLHYYAATSYEYMGRTAHIFSAIKIPLLTNAMERFQTAYESLPATIPAPVLNPNQTYSPVTFLHSPTLSARSSSSAIEWSPAHSPDHGVTPVIGPGPNAEALSVRNLSAFNARMVQTPPAPVPAPSPSRASSSSMTTDFCITPPPAPAREVLRFDHDAPPPAFHIPPPTRPPPPPPCEAPARPATRDQLLSFNSARDRLPNGASIVRNIARMIDNSMIAAADDPFLTRAPPNFADPKRPPLRLSPIKFPVEFDDPVKRRELIPSPLAIRKSSGEVHMCRNSAIVIHGGKEPQTSMKEKSYSIRAPRPKRPTPFFPSPMTMTPSTPTPVPRKKMPPLASPFVSRPASPGQESVSSPSLQSRKPSPAPVSAERAAQINNFNSAVKWLREHIPADITGLRKEIKHVSDMQHARRSRNTTMARSASFWTFSPVKPSTSGGPQEPPVIEGPNLDEYGNIIRVETKAQRIKRLREEDWRIGIQSKHSHWKGTEYYDNLCEDALAELGETGYGSRDWLQR